MEGFRAVRALLLIFTFLFCTLMKTPLTTMFVVCDMLVARVLCVDQKVTGRCLWCILYFALSGYVAV